MTVDLNLRRRLNLAFLCLICSGHLEDGKEGNPKRRTREVQETELVEEAEEGGEGHSCDKEVRRKDVASVGLWGK